MRMSSRLIFRPRYLNSMIDQQYEADFLERKGERSATLDPHLELVNGTAEVKSGTNGLSESGPLAKMGIIGSVGLHIMSMHVWGYPRTSRSAEARNS